MSYYPQQYPAATQRMPYPVQPPPQPTYHPQPGYPVYPNQQYSRPPPPQPVRPAQPPPVQPRQPAPKPPVKAPSQFPQLENLSKEELQDLLDNEDKINDIVKDLEIITKEKLTKEMCLAENRSLAEFNLSRQPRLTDGRQKLARSYEKNQQLRETFEQNMANLNQKQKEMIINSDRFTETGTIVSSKHSLDSVLALLQASASQAEDDAEEIADKFLDGKIEVDDFVEDFRAKRIVYNLKKTKSEELKKLIQQPQKPASTYNNQPSTYPAPYSINRAYTAQPQMSSYGSSQYMPQQSMPTLPGYPR